ADHWVWVLAGVPRPAMAAAITPPFLRVLLGYLRARFARVVVDLAALPTGPDAIARAVLEEATRILLVCGGDLTAAWHAEQALGALKADVGDAAGRLRLVVNKHDGAWQPPSPDIARALGWEGEVLATIPHDHHAIQQALRDQRPLVEGRG